MSTVLEEAAKNIAAVCNQVVMCEDHIQIVYNENAMYITCKQEDIVLLHMKTAPIFRIKTNEEKNKIMSYMMQMNEGKTLAKLMTDEKGDVIATCDLFLGRTKSHKYILEKCFRSLVETKNEFLERMK